MKKKLICLLTLICLFVASLTSAVLVSADSASIVDNKYTADKSAVFESSQEGGIFYATGITHAEVIGFYFKEGVTLNEAEHTYVHMKGIISSNVNRIKLQSKYLFNKDETNRGNVVLGKDDLVFEYHGKLTDIVNDYSDPYFEYGIDHISFQMYVTEGTATLEMLGVVFNNEATYDGFAAPMGGEVVDPKPEEPKPEEPTGELTLGEMVVPEVATVTKNEAGEQVVTYSASAGWATYNVEVSGYKSNLTIFRAEFTPSADVTICFAIGENNIDWSISHKLYAGGEKAVQEIDLTQFTMQENFTIMMYIDAEVTVEAEKSIVFHSLAFIDPNAGVEDDGSLAIEDIVAPSPATVTKNEAGEQVVTYSASAGWHTYNAKVRNYDSTLTVFRAEFTPSADVTICFAIGENNIDWSLDHKLYAGGQRAVQEIDLTQFTMQENFTIMMYIDASVTVEAEKSIVFHSLSFKTPDPEPAGMTIAEPKFDALTGKAMSEGGYEISWTNVAGEALWRKAGFQVKNFDTDYDILVVKMHVLEGTNLGVYMTYNQIEGEQVFSKDVAVRSHWEADGLVTATGEIEMVFLFKAFGIQGLTVTGFSIYLDNPTGNYTLIEGERTAKILSYEFKKSSEISFGELTINAPAKVADFTGEAVKVEATASANVALRTEYEVMGENGQASWTTSAPSKAGTYNVRVIFMGSLEYDYTVVTTTLTINKVQAVVGENDVVINAETREIAIEEGVLVSMDPDFTEGYEVANGDLIAYGQVLYVKRPADDNHFESEVVTITFNRPVQEDSSVIVPDSSNQTSETPNPDPAPADKGCISSMLGAELSIALFGAIAMFIRRKRA